MFGWSFNSNSFFQQLSEEVNQSFVIDKQNIQHRSFAIGADFGPLCTVYPDQFVNLSEPDKPCATSDDIANLLTRVRACVKGYEQDLIDAKQVGDDYYQTLMTSMRDQCGV